MIDPRDRLLGLINRSSWGVQATVAGRVVPAILALEPTDLNNLSGNTQELKLSGVRVDRDSCDVDDGRGQVVRVTVGDPVSAVIRRDGSDMGAYTIRALESTTGALIRARLSQD